MNNQIEQTLDIREVAEMIGKEHHKLLRDIRRYIEQLGESKIGFTDFFGESTYQTEQNKEMPCYRITKKGCEFIAHKLTGTKGTAFTARYINRFHEMQELLSGQVLILKSTRSSIGKNILLEFTIIMALGIKILINRENLRTHMDLNMEKKNSLCSFIFAEL